MCSIELLTADLPQSTSILTLSSLSPSKLHKISPLHHFPHLKILNLSNNMILKIQNIPASITTLNLQFNQIQRLQNIRHLLLLQQLYLSSNSIKEIVDSLGWNKRLRILELAHNELGANSLNSISECEGLNVLSLEGNEGIERINYRTIAVMMMKELIVLDRQTIGKERTQGLIWKEGMKEQQQEKEVEVDDQKQTILKEGPKINNHSTIIRSQIDPEIIIQDKINKTKLKNINLIQQIAQQQQKFQQLQQLQDQYQPSSSQQNDNIDANGQSIQQEQLHDFIKLKYQQSLKLQKQLKQLQEIPHPTLSQQKHRNYLLESLIENEQILEEFQKKLQHLRSISFRQNQHYSSIKSQQLASHRITLSSEITSVQSLITSLKKQLKHNQNLLISYLNNLSSNFKPYQQSHILQQLTKLVFGQQNKSNRDISQQLLKDLCDKYSQGLLSVLEDLRCVMFGNQVPPSVEKIRELKENLGGKALLDWFCEKKGSYKREKKFLMEKENFIVEFKKETEELMEGWIEFKQQQGKFYKKVSQFEKRQKQQQTQLKQSLRKVKQEHNFTFKKQLQQQISILNHMKIQISSLQHQKSIITNQLVALQQTKYQLSTLKSQLQKINHQIRKKKLQLESLTQTSQSTIHHHQSIQKKSHQIQELYNQKYSEFLTIEAECKVLNSKLALVSVEHNQIGSEVEEGKEYLTRLKRMIVQEEKVLERTKGGVMVMEDKLQNLGKLVGSKKYVLEGIEREIGRMAVLTMNKKRSSESEQELLIQGSVLKNKKSFQIV